MTRDEMIQMIRQHPGMQLATVDEDGCPHTRGMMMYSIDETGVVFHTSNEKDVYRQLRSAPKVEVSFFNREQFTQIRVQGTAVEIDDDDFRRKIVDTPGREFLKPWVAQKGLSMIRIFRIENCVADVWTMGLNFTYPRPRLKF